MTRHRRIIFPPRKPREQRCSGYSQHRPRLTSVQGHPSPQLHTGPRRRCSFPARISKVEHRFAITYKTITIVVHLFNAHHVAHTNHRQVQPHVLTAHHDSLPDAGLRGSVDFQGELRGWLVVITADFSLTRSPSKFDVKCIGLVAERASLFSFTVSFGWMSPGLGLISRAVQTSSSSPSSLTSPITVSLKPAWRMVLTPAYYTRNTV